MDIQSTQYTSLHIGHLGLVADMLYETRLIQEIDKRLPISESHGAKVTHGERVAAMILNGLGFIDCRLYLFPKFLADKAIDRLFGKPLKPEWFNDDALGRTLVAINAYGTTKLFSELALKIGSDLHLLSRSFHLDTTTLSLFGDYFNAQGDATPQQGFAKSGRHDLKQMVLLLATTGAAHMPVWMESLSGNVSDQVSLPDAAKRLHQFCSQLMGSEDFIYVADSALYSNILEQSTIQWLTRVPERIREAKQLSSKPNEEIDWQDLAPGYKGYEIKSTYKCVNQRWLLVFSEAAYQREITTLEKNIEQAEKSQEKQWWHLSNQQFKCRDDAQDAIKKLRKTLKYHQVITEVKPVTQYASPGRPKADTKQQVVGYQIHYRLEQDSEKIEEKKRTKGRFILATNIVDASQLSQAEMLTEYKGQSGTESGFKFIKDNTFEVDNVFLKTPERIDALMMVMTLCLMIYGLSQHKLRQSLKAKKVSIPSQSGKMTQNPSMKWVYFLFRSVHELYIQTQSTLQRVILNVHEGLQEIIRHFGSRARAIYFNSS